MLSSRQAIIADYDENFVRYFLCHLYEIGRGEDKMWTNAHAAIAKDMIRVENPGCRVEIPGMGQGYTIWTKEI